MIHATPARTPKRNAADSVNEYVSYLKSQTDIEDILEYSQKVMKNLNVVRKSNPKT